MPTKTPERPESFEKLTEREWKRIAKNPDKHAGKGIVVHGEVTQFDAATGGSMFRADVGGRYRQPEYGFVMYETNTVLEGDPGDLEDLVSGDLFTAKATVLESMSYDTQIGGETRAPPVRMGHQGHRVDRLTTSLVVATAPAPAPSAPFRNRQTGEPTYLHILQYRICELENRTL